MTRERAAKLAELHAELARLYAEEADVEVATPEVAPLPSPPEDCGKPNDSAAVGLHGDDVGTLRAQAERVLRAVDGRNRFALRYAVELAEEVLRATGAAATDVPTAGRRRRSGGAA